MRSKPVFITIYLTLFYPAKTAVISSNFLVWKFLETLGKLCLSTKFPHQEIRWNYGILRSFIDSHNDRCNIEFIVWCWIHIWSWSPLFCDAIMISATTVKLLCISYDLLHATGHHYSCAFEVGFFSCNYKTSDFAERFTKTSIKFGNHY